MGISSQGELDCFRKIVLKLHVMNVLHMGRDSLVTAPRLVWCFPFGCYYNSDLKIGLRVGQPTVRIIILYVPVVFENKILTQSWRGRLGLDCLGKTETEKSERINPPLSHLKLIWINITIWWQLKYVQFNIPNLSLKYVKCYFSPICYHLN